MQFEDRRDAGRRLAAALMEYAGQRGVIVLALPRGGLPVGYEVAQALRAPLDVFVVRKLGVPGEEELALGAIASGGVRVLNREVVEALSIPEWQIQMVAEREQIELERRERQYRGGRPPLNVEGKTVILTDDGLATGSTMRAAAAALRQQKPKEIVIAVPVGARATCRELGAEANRMVCLYTPESFFAVGQWYRHFEQITDEEVQDFLARAAHESQSRQADQDEDPGSRGPETQNPTDLPLAASRRREP
jgi:putative phosphoribosyl transferase